MFQNDLSFHVRDANLTMYADDHQLYVIGKDSETVWLNLKAQGQQASYWYYSNYLLANSDMFQSLAINPRKLSTRNTDVALCKEDQEIKETEQIKLFKKLTLTII